MDIGKLQNDDAEWRKSTVTDQSIVDTKFNYVTRPTVCSTR